MAGPLAPALAAEPQLLTLLRPVWHYGTTPTGLALALGAGSNLKDMGESFNTRHQRYRRLGIEAPIMEPGDLPVADAKPFIEKRSTLQGTKTAAIPGWLGAPTLLGGPLIAAGALGGGSGQGPVSEIGARLRRMMFPSAIGRANVEEEAAKSLAMSLGKQTGIAAVNLFGDLLSKAREGLSGFMKSRAGLSIFNELRKEDEEIAGADPALLTDAYHTMVRFAPTLATDKNAVKTFLREAVLMGTGPNVVTIKQLADAERAVNPPPGK